MDYSYDFAKIKANYPEKIGLEQMRVICHISKKTARYLLTSGLVPSINTGKKTRQYIINTKDVIAYLKKRQSQPEKFSAPTGYYSASWNKGGKPKMLTLREWAGYRQKQKEVSGLSYPENAALQRCAECCRGKPAYRLSPQHPDELVP